jgi:asparagine synthetase A
MSYITLNKENKKKHRYDKIIRPEGRDIHSIEEIVRKIYDSLKKEEKYFIEDAEQSIMVLSHTIMVDGEEGRVNPYATLIKNSESNARSEHRDTFRVIWEAFKAEKQALYNKYNSYMFRRGYKSTQYFFENATLSQDGSLWTADLELPKAPFGKISYETLSIEYDFSGNYITEAFMQ